MDRKKEVMIKKIILFATLGTLTIGGVKLVLDKNSAKDKEPNRIEFMTDEDTITETAEEMVLMEENDENKTLTTILSEFNQNNNTSVTLDDIEVECKDKPMYVFNNNDGNYIYNLNGEDGYSFHDECQSSGHMYLIKMNEGSKDNPYWIPIAGMYYDNDTEPVNIVATTYDGVNYHNPHKNYVNIDNPTKEKIEDLQKYIDSKEGSKSL